jgi:4-diphosphocytidyl-2-C-methyl-D-erythritol kinase
LSDVAKKLGSDVPFFLLGGTALTEGRGEVLKQLPSMPKLWLVLTCPPISLEGKTRRLYSLIQPSHYTDGSYTQRLISQMQARPSLDGLLYNVFEKVAHLAYTELHKYIEQLKTAGMSRSMLAGAGPALFSFVKNELEGKEAMTKLSAAQTKAYLAHSL